MLPECAAMHRALSGLGRHRRRAGVETGRADSPPTGCVRPQTPFLTDRAGNLAADYYEAVCQPDRYPQIHLATPVEARRAPPRKRCAARRCRAFARGGARSERSKPPSNPPCSANAAPGGSPLVDPPLLTALHRNCVPFPQVLQEAGEIIFVPPFWHHQVENLTDALSINHNWLNAAGLHWAWTQLRADLAACEAQIEDCRPLCSPDEFAARTQPVLAGGRSPVARAPSLASWHFLRQRAVSLPPTADRGAAVLLSLSVLVCCCSRVCCGLLAVTSAGSLPAEPPSKFRDGLCGVRGHGPYGRPLSAADSR